MPAIPSPEGNCSPLYRALLWDLAGTLLVRDPWSGRTGPIPDGEEVLKRLARDWRMVVTTGEESESANSLLRGYQLLPHFEEVYGDLLGHGGKPHGEILREMRAKPACSLVIGDRLGGDLPIDTEKLVLLLVGSRGEATSATRIAEAVDLLAETAPNCLEAFRSLCEAGRPRPERIGPMDPGIVNAAWTSEKLTDAELWLFQPAWSKSQHPVIVL